jgi:hypothetical protein
VDARALGDKGSSWQGRWVGGVVALATAVWAGAVVRLPGPAVTDPDGHASALYFERLIHGQRLEELLLSTPKPLLTLTHGLAWTITHDWRTVTLLTIIAFALAVTALARTAARVGGLPAAVASLVAVAGSGTLLLQVARGNSLVWALAGWAVALDALTARERPRWLLAGGALLIAGLARTESWLLLPLVALYAAWAWRRGDRAALWLLAAFAAPVIWLAHDFALIGDPLWSSAIPARYTDLIAGRQVIPPTTWAAEIARRYAAEPALLALAVAGAAWLVVRRAWQPAVGIAALALGVLVLLGWYASQGVYISWRYFDPPDVAVRLLAAFGAAWLATWLATALATMRPTRNPSVRSDRKPLSDPNPLSDPRPLSDRNPLSDPNPTSDPSPTRERSSPARSSSTRTAGISAIAGVVTCLAVVAAAWPIGPADPLVDSTLDRDTRLAANATTAVESLRPVAAGGQPVTVSGPQRVRIALALDQPLGQVRDLFVDTLHTPLDQALAKVGAVYHDADGDRPTERFTPLTRTTPGSLGSLQLTPIHTDPGTGLYVHRVAPVPSPAAPSTAPGN